MAKAVSTLSVLVKANSGNFRKEMKRSRKVANRFGKTIKAIGRKTLKFGTILSAAGTTGLVLLTKQGFSAIDALSKVSTKLGIATEDLAGLQLAGELTGVKIETMNMALQRMTRRVAEAAIGTGEAKDAIKSLGLDAKELGKLAPDKAFLKIAEAMEGVTDSGQRVRLAFKLFDSEGVSLINTLGLGVDQLREISEQADRFGLSLSKVEAKQVEQANNAFLKLRRVFTGLGRTIAKRLAPLVKFLSDSFVNAATEGEGIGSAVTFAANQAIGAMGGILDVITLIQRGWARVIQLIAKTNLAMVNVNPLATTMDKIVAIVQKGFADALVMGLENLPSGEERVRKFLKKIEEQSREAAEAAVLKEGPDVSALGFGDKEKGRFTIGFRDPKFAAALRGGGALTTQVTPETKKLDKTNTLLQTLIDAIRKLKLGLT